MIGSWNINPSLIWPNWTDFTLNRSFHFTSFLFFKWLAIGILDDSAARWVTVGDDISIYQPVLKLPNQFSISTFHLGSCLVPFQLLPKSLIEPYSIVFLVHFNVNFWKTSFSDSKRRKVDVWVSNFFWTSSFWHFIYYFWNDR